MARSDALGAPKTVELPQGPIGYREAGTGSPVVFVHGLLVNADLWRHVVPAVAAAGHRCLSPDWPLGSHEIPMRPGIDLTPPAVADLIGDFLDALDLTDVTLVGNDTGGALVQLLMVRRPERIGRVVLASCDALERFFPPLFGFLPVGARLPGSTWLLAQALRSRAVRRLPIAYGRLARRPIPDEAMDSYLRPVRRDPGVRRDLRAFLRGVHRRHTLAAARSFGAFAPPVLLAWGTDERLFPLSLAHRLAGLLPDARVVPVPGSATLIPEDRPGALADLIVEFAAAPKASGPSPAGPGHARPGPTAPGAAPRP